MPSPLFLEDCGIVTPLGRGKAEVARALFAGSHDGIVLHSDLVPNRSVYVGAVRGDLPSLPAALAGFDCRNNRLMQMALMEIAPAVERAISRYGRDRIAVVLGTSTGGGAEGEDALAIHQSTGAWPATYHYRQQEISSLSIFSARFFGLTGPAYAVATACSSSAKVFASARRLIKAGLADAAIVGGADTLCRMSLNGFSSLELLSKEKCNPFSANRDGITIGEGASAFLLGSDEGPVQFLGIGETSDAYHLTAPDPEGGGARNAMLQALNDAGLTPADIVYINLHGTATPLNDAMEARAVTSVFGHQTLCSSTKGMTGHMLGATGGCEAAFLWLALNPATNPGSLPPHVWDGVPDPALPALNLVTQGTSLPQSKRLAMLSNSFGFSGSNAALIFGTPLSNA
jgi:3-oxoacyl-[acyl-carrier-protein] synthase-1